MGRHFVYDKERDEVVEVGAIALPPRADMEFVSDSMGFTEAALPQWEEDRVKNGFTGIEFTKDPTEPTFRQVRCRGRKEYERYIRHRGMFDQSTAASVRLTQGDLDRAAELVGRTNRGP